MSIKATSSESALTQEYKKNAKRVREAEKEAQTKIQNINNQVKTAQEESHNELEGIKDQFEQQSISEKDRNAALLEQQRLEGYERLLQLKRAQEAEINRAKRQGEKQFQDTKSFYEYQTSVTEDESKKNLQKLKHESMQSSAYLDTKTKNDFELANKVHTSNINTLTQEHQQKLEFLENQKREELTRNKENFTTLAMNSKEKHENQYKSLLSDQQQSLSRVNRAATDRLHDLRASSAQKLAAYQRRQEDPFYKLMNFNAVLEEKDDAFIISAKIPPHEREGISVAIRGNQAVISGSRQNSEKLEVSPGNVQTTNAYQTYSQSFPLNGAVDARSVQKEFNDDQMTIIIPKMNYEKKRDPYHFEKGVNDPKLVKAPVPDFPKNIPLEEPDVSLISQPRPGGKSLG